MAWRTSDGPSIRRARCSLDSRRHHGKKPATETVVFRGKAITCHHEGPTLETAALIGKVNLLLAQGRSLEEAAKELGRSRRNLEDLKLRHGELWQHAATKAARSVKAAVLAIVGTEKMLEDPTRYCNQVNFVDQTLKRCNEELFPPGKELTLSVFYEKRYVPNCLFEAAEETKRDYLLALHHWRLITGDPPLGLITSEILARFRDVLIGMRGKRVGSRMSPNSVRSRMLRDPHPFDKGWTCRPAKPRRDGTD